MTKKGKQEPKKRKAVASSSFITSIRKDKEQEKRKAKKTLLITCACILIAGALLAGWAFLSASDYFCTHSAAARVKNHSVTPVMFDYFYRDAYSGFCQQYLDLVSVYLDTTKPLDEQWYDQQNNVTWADYFVDLAESSIQRTYCLYDAAEANGYTLTAADEKALSDTEANLDTQAKKKSTDRDGYILSYYGRGCTIDTYREYIRIVRIADQYEAQYKAKLSYTQDTIDTYYESNRTSFDTVNYRIYSVAVKDDAGNVDLAASEAKAEQIAADSLNDEEKYLSLIEADAGPDSAYASGDYSRRDNYSYTYAPENLASWLFDTSRQAGDTTSAANGDNGWYVVYYLSLNTHDYDTVNLRVIEVADYYKDAKNALKSANALLAQYTSGEQTEAAFAALADANGAADGGSRQNVSLGQLDDAAEAWAFDAARQPGDTAAVAGTDSASSYVLYFCGTGKNCRSWFVEEALRDSAAEDWVSSLIGSDRLREGGLGMKYVTTK